MVYYCSLVEAMKELVLTFYSHVVNAQNWVGAMREEIELINKMVDLVQDQGHKFLKGGI